MGSRESKPWRDVALLPNPASWTREVEDSLRKTCQNVSSYDSKSVKILMVGATQNGKSSLVNSLLSAATGKFNQYVMASKAQHSVTRQLHSPIVDVNFRLTDMPGIFQGMGDKAGKVVELVLNGEVKENVDLPVNFDGNGLVGLLQKRNDPPCCVVLVMRAGNYLGGDVKKIFDIVIQKAGELQLKVAVVLTHVDNLQDDKGPNLKGKNLARIFHEETVHKAVQQASDETGLPMGFIHPIVNYTHQVETTLEMNILHLHTLSKILDMAQEGARYR